MRPVVMTEMGRPSGLVLASAILVALLLVVRNIHWQ